MKKSNLRTGGAARVLLAAVALIIALSACGNPAMKEVLRPLSEDEEEAGGAAGPAYLITFSFGEGGGTAPAPRTAAAGTAIVLPGIGAMTAPNGRPVLTGWHNGAALYRPGAAYTVFYPVTLTARWDSVANALAAAIAAAALAGKDGNSAANAVPLTIAIDLGTMPGTAWQDLLTAIATANKYVALDLSACGITGDFDPGSANTGEPLITALTLPGAATGITGSFYYFTALTEIHGSNVDSIGLVAFYGCTSLTTVYLPAATSIGDSAFSGCSALTTANLPQAASIGDGAFYNCTGLTTVNLPAATSIGDSAFSGCSALTTVNLPAATSIGTNAFDGCSGLTSVYLPEATSIGSQAFYECTSLTTVYLPKATSIGTNAFYGCTGLTTVNLPAATSIGERAFENCTGLTTVNLPAATSIGDSAFRNTGTTALTVTLGAAPPTVGTNMFLNVNSTKNVTVKRPASGATAYGPSPTNTTDNNWGNAFRGRGWTSPGGPYGTGTVNGNINLTIQGL
ncbi:MAG: leucine-rich repeat domain-containing protein [Treponema sp.]|jgi:hypothetical protein|nr:leucine-rich repeat domain-containing protein [Treponema sp.]